jgi:hypothetical protein
MIEAPARARNEMKGCGEVGICDCGVGSSTRGCWPQTTQRLVCRETKQLQRCLLCDHGQSEAGPLKAMFAGEKGRRIRRGCSVATAPGDWCSRRACVTPAHLTGPHPPKRRVSISSPPHTRPRAQQALRCFILPMKLNAFGCSACCRDNQTVSGPAFCRMKHGSTRQ